MNKSVTLEVCVDSIESALAAERGGADRIELCSALIDGGVTPSYGLIAAVRESVRIAVHVMIRPRGSDFCYSDDEFKIMQRDITVAKQLRADGVVIGLLDVDGQVDVARTRELVAFAAPLKVTFHRAFDMSSDPLKALHDLQGTGVHYILTSGGKQSAIDGMDTLRRIVRAAGDQIRIIAAAGILEDNVRQLIEQTGVREIHASAKCAVDSVMRFRNEGISMGALPGQEYHRFVAQQEKIQRLLLAASARELKSELPRAGKR